MVWSISLLLGYSVDGRFGDGCPLPPCFGSAKAPPRTAQTADVLSMLLLVTGDAVALVLPMTPLAVAAYLGIILAGCAVVSVAGEARASAALVLPRVWA